MDSATSVVPLANADISERELRHLAAAWLSSDAGGTINFEVFMVLAGHPNVKNARKRFGEIKKKVRERVFLDGTAGAPAKTEAPAKTDTVKTTTPRKRKTGGDGNGTPRNKRGRKAAELKKEPKVEGDMDVDPQAKSEDEDGE